MARIRTVKPEFWTSEQVAECSPTTRLLFIGMWNFCDDGGNHPASIKQLKMQIFPSDDISIAEIEGMVKQLISNDLIAQYTVNNKNFWHVLGWHHQKIEKPNYKHPAYSPTSSQPFAEDSPTSSQPFDPVMESKGMEGNVDNKKEKSACAENSKPAEDIPDYAQPDNREPYNPRAMFEMHVDWQPTDSIRGLLGRAGLPTDIAKLDQSRIGDFVNYWIGKPDRKTADGWNGQLAGWLKRTQHDKPKVTAGYSQPVDPPEKPIKYFDPASTGIKRELMNGNISEEEKARRRKVADDAKRAAGLI